MTTAITSTVTTMKTERDELVKQGFDPKWVERLGDKRVGAIIVELRERARQKAKRRAAAEAQD